MNLGLDRTREILFLSFGGGQDSTALLFKYVFSGSFRADYVGDRQLVVLMADTQNEHDATIEHVAFIKRFCATWQIPFVHITADLGYHTGAWKGGLLGSYRANHTIGMPGPRAKVCSNALKIEPFYACANDIVGAAYGFKTPRKAAFYAYNQRFGKRIEVWVGLSRGEESRAAHVAEDHRLAFDFDIEQPKAPARDLWFDRNIRVTYPLISLGMDRHDCQTYIASLGFSVPRTSHCKSCHWKHPNDVLHLQITDPAAFEEWAQLEEAKIAHWADKTEKNWYVFKDRSLKQVARDARAALSHMSHAPHGGPLAHAFSQLNKTKRRRVRGDGRTPTADVALCCPLRLGVHRCHSPIATTMHRTLRSPKTPGKKRAATETMKPIPHHGCSRRSTSTA
jgi:hypothetical protein